MLAVRERYPCSWRGIYRNALRLLCVNKITNDEKHLLLCGELNVLDEGMGFSVTSAH